MGMGRQGSLTTIDSVRAFVVILGHSTRQSYRVVRTDALTLHEETEAQRSECVGGHLASQNQSWA